MRATQRAGVGPGSRERHVPTLWLVSAPHTEPCSATETAGNGAHCSSHTLLTAEWLLADTGVRRESACGALGLVPRQLLHPGLYPMAAGTWRAQRLVGLDSLSPGTAHGRPDWRITPLHRLVQRHHLKQKEAQAVLCATGWFSCCGCIGPCLYLIPALLPPHPSLRSCSHQALSLGLLLASPPVPALMPRLQSSVTSPGSNPSLILA